MSFDEWQDFSRREKNKQKLKWLDRRAQLVERSKSRTSWVADDASENDQILGKIHQAIISTQCPSGQPPTSEHGHPAGGLPQPRQGFADRQPLTSTPSPSEQPPPPEHGHSAKQAPSPKQASADEQPLTPKPATASEQQLPTELPASPKPKVATDNPPTSEQPSSVQRVSAKQPLTPKHAPLSGKELPIELSGSPKPKVAIEESSTSEQLSSELSAPPKPKDATEELSTFERTPPVQRFSAKQPHARKPKHATDEPGTSKQQLTPTQRLQHKQLPLQTPKPASEQRLPPSQKAQPEQPLFCGWPKSTEAPRLQSSSNTLDTIESTMEKDRFRYVKESVSMTLDSQRQSMKPRQQTEAGKTTIRSESSFKRPSIKMGFSDFRGPPAIPPSIEPMSKRGSEGIIFIEPKQESESAPDDDSLLVSRKHRRASRDLNSPPAKRRKSSTIKDVPVDRKAYVKPSDNAMKSADKREGGVKTRSQAFKHRPAPGGVKVYIARIARHHPEALDILRRYLEHV